MTRPSIYQLENVRKRNSDAFVLELAQFGIALGEVFSLVGPTGAGKSTLLRLLTGLESTTTGTIVFDGMPMVSDSFPLEMQRRIATVHQRPLLVSGSVKYNVEIGLRARGIKSREQFTEPLLKRLGLTKFTQHDAHTLSGGQVQLVALARAIVVQPDVLLLDEPTANLDPALVATVEEIVLETRQARPMTVVWTTHNLFQARRVADRVGLLLGGQLIEVAEKPAFFETPKDYRTAQFIEGKMVY